MKSTTLKITVLFVLLASHFGYVSATDSEDERKKRHVVSRLYEITESKLNQCSHAPSDVANKYKREVSRFIEANTQLMALVKQSPHYAYAQKNYGNERSNPRETEEMFASGCVFISDLIGMMIDTPQGITEVDKFFEILSGVPHQNLPGN